MRTTARVSLRPVGVMLAVIGLCLLAIAVRQAYPMVMLLGCAAMSAVVLSFVLRPQLEQVTLVRWAPLRAVVGEPLMMELGLRNPTARAMPAMHLELDGTPYFARTTLVCGPMLAGAEVIVPVQVEPIMRGVAQVLVIGMSSSAPFGLVRRTRIFMARGAVRVHPRRVAAVQLDARSAGGEFASGVADRTGTLTHAVRDYRPGDSSRHVHWRSTARRGHLVVAEPEREHGRAITVLVAGPVLEGGRPADPWEQSIAQVAWSLASTLVDGATAHLCVARPDGGFNGLLVSDPTDALDWFAGLGAVRLPSELELDRLMSGLGLGDQLVVLAAPDAPDAWWSAAQGVASRTGRQIGNFGSAPKPLAP